VIGPLPDFCGDLFIMDDLYVFMANHLSQTQKTQLLVTGASMCICVDYSKFGWASLKNVG